MTPDGVNPDLLHLIQRPYHRESWPRDVPVFDKLKREGIVLVSIDIWSDCSSASTEKELSEGGGGGGGEGTMRKERERGRLTDRQTETDRQTDGKTDRKTGKDRDVQRHTEIFSGSKTDSIPQKASNCRGLPAESEYLGVVHKLTAKQAAHNQNVTTTHTKCQTRGRETRGSWDH